MIKNLPRQYWRSKNISRRAATKLITQRPYLQPSENVRLIAAIGSEPVMITRDAHMIYVTVNYTKEYQFTATTPPAEMVAEIGRQDIAAEFVAACVGWEDDEAFVESDDVTPVAQNGLMGSR